MATRLKTSFSGYYNNGATGLFKANTTKLIGSDDARSLVTDLIDSFWQTSVTNPAITTGNVEFNFQGCEKGLFVILTNLATATIVSFTNTSLAREFTFIVNVTNVAGKLTFPASVIMSDVRWEALNPQEFIFTETGKFKGHAWFDGTNWILEISQAPFV